MSYLLSIIVPTKDRYLYLKPLITLVSGFNLSEIELVIQDNTQDNTEILDFIGKLQYPHLKYYHHVEKIPLEQNATWAVINSTGEYVCMIGDDDGVSRTILDTVKWMKKNSIEALRSRLPYHYLWPDAVINSNNKKSSIVAYHQSRNSCDFLNAIVELGKVGKIGMQYIGQMPKLYHGVVKRDVLDMIYKIGGRYFPGAAGDMANAVALSFIVSKFVVVDFPVTIHGSSKMLGGGIVMRKKEMATLEEVDFVSQSVKDNWEKSIPPIWHTCFVWPESACKALKYMAKEDYIARIDFDYMLAHFLSRVGLSFFGMCFKYSTNRINLIRYYLRFRFVKMLVKLKKFLSYAALWDRRFLYSVKIEKNISNILEAEEVLYSKTNSIDYTSLRQLH